MNRGLTVKSKLLALGASIVMAVGIAAMSPVVFAADAGADLHTNKDPGTNAGADLHTNKDPDTNVDTRDLEARLADARARLEQAAHEVAELSSELGGPLVNKFMVFDGFQSRAMLGVQLDPESGNEGAKIQEVSPGGPAQEAGLRVGDVITQINGTDIKGDRTARQVVRSMRKIEPESKVNVRVTRDGKSQDFVVTTRRSQSFVGMNQPFIGPFPPFPPGEPPGVTTFGPVMIHGALGQMELATLTPQLGRYFGTDKGVLVVRAPKDFKLEDGDVIVAIDGREPTSGSHATRILASYQPGEKISIKVMRQHKAIDVETTLPERAQPMNWGPDGEGRGFPKIKMMTGKEPGATT